MGERPDTGAGLHGVGPVTKPPPPPPPPSFRRAALAGSLTRNTTSSAFLFPSHPLPPPRHHAARAHAREGGDTTFYERLPGRGGGDDGATAAARVRPARGAVLCFFHGHHPRSPLHEGAPVARGAKYVARTDVLYRMTPLADDDDEGS